MRCVCIYSWASCQFSRSAIKARERVARRVTRKKREESREYFNAANHRKKKPSRIYAGEVTFESQARDCYGTVGSLFFYGLWVIFD